MPAAPIGSVASDIKDYFLKTHLVLSVILVLIVIALEILIYISVFQNQSLGSAPSPFWYAVPLLIFVGAYALAKKNAEKTFFGAFAQSIGFSYSWKGDPDTLASTMLGDHFRRAMFNVLAGTYKDLPLTFCSYSYTVSSGVGQQQHQHTYHFSVFEFSLPNPLPAIILLPKAHLFHSVDLSARSANVRKLPLEGDFDAHFEAYAAPGKEIEALQLLEPDDMAVLIDRFSGWTIESTGAKLTCLKEMALPKDEPKLRALLQDAEALYDLLLPEARNIH